MTGGPRQILRQVVRDAINAGERSGELKLDSLNKSELETKLLDAFEAGNVHDAVVMYGKAAHNRRGQRVLNRIMDSALLTLGVSVSGAREAWFEELSALSKRLEAGAMPNSAREYPVRDAFRGISVPLNPTTSKVLRDLALVKARFDASLNFALNSAAPLEALRTLAEKTDLEKLPDQSLMALIEAFVDRDSFKDVISVFEASPAGFRSYPAPWREYALALHMVGEDDRAQLELTALMTLDSADPIAAGLQGKLAKERAFDCLEIGHTAEGKVWLNQALESYQTGFKLDRTQLYPGVNIPGLLIALGRPEEAKQQAKTLLTLAELRASYGERNFFDATAALEMNAVLGRGDAVSMWLGRALESASEPWQRKSVVTGLERLAEQLAKNGDSTMALLEACRVLRGVEGSRAAAPDTRIPSKDAMALSEVQKVTYRFGARHARRLTGNYQFSGIAHDVRVTPADLRFFTRIVHDEGWDYLQRPGDVSRQIDVLVRTRFGTAALEEINSPEHRAFDETMPGLARFMGAKENSQTNVSADWLNGLGDCRQHAPTKMLLFEAWKRSRTDYLMERLGEAHAAGKTGVIRATESDLFELARYEMRVMDALVVASDGAALIEEHTLTVLSKRKPKDARGEMTELESLDLADSFYHRVHALASGQLSIANTPNGLELGVPKPSADGRNISLIPASYSRDRSTSSPDFGQLEFRGIQVATPGWEREVPTAGLDLSDLHGYVRHRDAPAS